MQKRQKRQKRRIVEENIVGEESWADCNARHERDRIARIEKAKCMKLITLDENHQLPRFEGKPLVGLKWGHPALIEWFGEHFSSFAAYENWLETTFADDARKKSGG